MSTSKSGTVALAAAFTLLGSIAGAGAASANEPYTLELPAGTACDFGVRIDGTGGHTITREFADKDGNVVRILSTGTGSALTFTNVGSGATLSLRSNGAVGRTTTLADGSTLIEGRGHNVLILFPTDVPAGPSTVLYTGQYEVTVAPTGVWTLQTTRGTSRDLCAELSD